MSLLYDEEMLEEIIRMEMEQGSSTGRGREAAAADPDAEAREALLRSFTRALLREHWDDVLSGLDGLQKLQQRPKKPPPPARRRLDQEQDEGATASAAVVGAANTTVDPMTRILGVLLGTACLKPSVPAALFEKVLSIDRRAALYQDGWLRTPLQMIVSNLGRRHDLVRIVLDAAPECIHMRDMEGLRPIEVLTQKILIKEERFKYVVRQITARSNKEEDERSLCDHWECARLLAAAHVRSAAATADAGRVEDDGAESETGGAKAPVVGDVDEEDDDNNKFGTTATLLHTFVRATDIPLAIRERAIRRCPDQLRLPDPVSGNLPLHYAAAIPHHHLAAARRRQQQNEDDDDEEEEEEQEDMDDLLEEILNRYKAGASITNADGKFPIDLAIEAGRTWNTGIGLLLMAYPNAVENQNIPLPHFPIIFEELMALARRDNDDDNNARDRRGLSYLFGFLRANPDLVNFVLPDE